MREKKEPLVIECSACDARFRLWVPEKDRPSLEKGLRINCIRCGAAYLVRKHGDEVRVEAGAPRPVPRKEEGLAIESGEGPVPLAPLAPEEPGAAPAYSAPAGGVAVERGAGQPAPGAAALPVILVVEDDALSRKMVENSLQDGTRKLILVKDGESAIEALKGEKRVDLLVVDLYLKNPDDPATVLDGEQVLEEAARIGEIPAIVVTGKELVDDISLDPKWFDLHVKDFIQKGNPFWVDELKVKVSDIIAKR